MFFLEGGRGGGGGVKIMNYKIICGFQKNE